MSNQRRRFVEPVTFWISLSALASLLLSVYIAPASAAPALVLVPGIAGAAPSDFLMRNRQALEGRGLETHVAVSASEAIRTVAALAGQGKKVVLVGMSAGTPTVAQVIASGAPVAAAVFVSGALMPGPNRRSVSEILGSPARLPPSLVVHNSADACPGTPPDGARRFVAWSDGRAALKMLSTPGPQARPCGPMSPHGYAGYDAQAVSAIASFALRF